MPIRGSLAMTLGVRVLSEEERETLGRIARSRTVGAGQVRRAQIVLHALEGLKAPEITARMDLCGATVRHPLKRFNAHGLQGLEEDVRSGRPPTCSAEQRSAVINAALSRPSDLGLPFACWTLDRLVAHLSETGIGMKRSRISEILLAEGLTWRQEETWFGARVDPDFARKRGRSSTSTPPHPTPVLSSVLTRWDRKPSRAIPADAWARQPGHKRNEPNRKSTMAAATSPDTCLAPFSPPAARPSPPRIPAAPPQTGLTSSARSSAGSIRLSTGSMR